MNFNFSFIDASPYLVKTDSTIYEAMEVIEQGEERICFVTEDNKKLVKVISDGDIRRALLKDSDMNRNVNEIHDGKPIVVHEDQIFEEAEKLLSKRILAAPVIDKQGIVKGIVRYQDFVTQIDIKSYTIAIIGLGYVGLTLGLVMADEGFSVKGYDLDKNLINMLNKKEAPFYEKNIKNYINNNIGNNLNVYSDVDKILADIYIISVGTPINKKTKKPEVKNILKAIDNIAVKLKKNDLVVLRSTVPIGLTRNVVIPRLEEKSHLSVGKDFSIAFCPERTAEGRALEELRSLPQIVGGYDI